MDSDDISAKNRLETQVRYLTLHPDILAVGTARSIFGENVKRKIQCFPENFDDIKAYMFLACPIVHPSVMMRRDVFSSIIFDMTNIIVIWKIINYGMI